MSPPLFFFYKVLCVRRFYPSYGGAGCGRIFVAVMGVDTSHDIRWLRSRPTDAGWQPDKIDAEQGIIRDVVMVQAGEAKGHGVHLDNNFVYDLIAYDVKHFSKTGIKARFGHPGMSSEAMGTQMGVFKNFRTREMGMQGKVQGIADLHLLEAADESPTHPGMRSWVLKMAAERPDMLMSSIVFRPGGYFQLNEEGKKVYINDPYNANEGYGQVFVEFGKKGEHMATDIVEEGAATDRLFSNKINTHLFVAQAGDFLAEHPELTAFIKANPEKVTAFLQGIGVSIQQPQQKKMSKFSLTKWFLGEAQDAEPGADDLTALKTELSAAKEAFTALQAERDALENRVKELEPQVSALQENVAQLKKEAEALKADAATKAEEIERLKSEPAATHTSGETEPGAGNDELRAYEKNPVYLRAKRMREKQSKKQ